jgi:tripartite-type tricarboxylate transporter receptor subunit TctC
VDDLGYGATPREPLWTGWRHVPLLVMPFVFILLACGYWRNPTMVGADGLLKSQELARGDVKPLVFFGAFFVLACIGTLLMDARKKQNPDWPRFAAVTSHIPFVAAAQGRNRIIWREIGWLRPLLGLALFVAFLLVHPWLFGVAAAQAYPSKPLRMLVGFAPGGANDILARIMAQKLSESLGQPVIVENRPGNAGLIAAEMLAKAPADGYTLMLGSTGTQTIAPNLTATLPYDAVNALAPVSLVGSAPSALVVHAGLPANSVRELIALAKSRSRPLTYASSGNGTTLHLGGELFKILTGVDLLHVPYKGNAPALNDVIGGQVDMMFSALPPLLPLARAGKLRILGVASLERHRSAPEVPTVAEAGVPGYEMGTWYGVFATGGSPADAVERLAADVSKALADPRVRETITAQGADPMSSTPAEFRRFFVAELEKWGKLIRAAGIKAD